MSNFVVTHPTNSPHVAQLVPQRNTGHDRASNWINNLLCIYYHDRLAPYTGGGAITPKSLRPTLPTKADELTNVFVTAPNPAEAYVTFTYSFMNTPSDAYVLVQDAVGRAVSRLPMLTTEAQLVLDTRKLARGVYTVSYAAQGEVLKLDKLILH